MARLAKLTERGLVTHRQLRDVLMSLLVEKGYEQVSVNDIAERGGHQPEGRCDVGMTEQHGDRHAVGSPA